MDKTGDSDSPDRRFEFCRADHFNCKRDVCIHSAKDWDNSYFRTEAEELIVYRVPARVKFCCGQRKSNLSGLLVVVVTKEKEGKANKSGFHSDRTTTEKVWRDLQNVFQFFRHFAVTEHRRYRVEKFVVFVRKLRILFAKQIYSSIIDTKCRWYRS